MLTLLFWMKLLQKVLFSQKDTHLYVVDEALNKKHQRISSIVQKERLANEGRHLRCIKAWLQQF